MARGADTRERLEAAALAALRENGVGGLTARAVAQRADVNQALIFYHYGTLFDLVGQAALASVGTAVGRYHVQFANTKSFRELLEVGRSLHRAERAAGNVAVMTQLTAGAQLDAGLAAVARQCLDQWVAVLEPEVTRLLGSSPVAGLLEPAGIARAVMAGFIGIELYDGVDQAGAALALSSLDQLGAVLEIVEDLGGVARRAARARVRRKISQRSAIS